MKIDLFINLLDEKKRLGKSAQFNVSVGEEALTESTQQRSDSEKNYRIDLSTRSLNSRTKLAYSVRDQNKDKLSLVSQKTKVPSSVSKGLKKPKAKDLDSLINSLTSDPKKLVEAHKKLNRTRTEDLLLNKK